MEVYTGVNVPSHLFGIHESFSVLLSEVNIVAASSPLEVSVNPVHAHVAAARLQLAQTTGLRHLMCDACRRYSICERCLLET